MIGNERKELRDSGRPSLSPVEMAGYRRKKRRQAWLWALGLLFLCAAAATVWPNISMLRKTAGRIEEAYEYDGRAREKAGAIVVLGCAVKEDGSPSPMLKERLDAALHLYEAGAADVIMLTGDHKSDDYNEVGAMAAYVTERGVPGEALVLDHGGLNTSLSIRHMTETFPGERVLLVSQRYHLYRAVYLAEEAGAEAFGEAADTRRYTGQLYRDIREVLARAKDYYRLIFQ